MIKSSFNDIMYNSLTLIDETSSIQIKTMTEKMVATNYQFKLGKNWKKLKIKWVSILQETSLDLVQLQDLATYQELG